MICLLITLTLAGCATQPAPKPSSNTSAQLQHLETLSYLTEYTLKGRLGVNANGKGYSGSIEWHHQPQHDDIDIYTPFGSKIANISKDSQTVVLTDAEMRSISAQDTETLTEKTLGWRLPLNGLSDWAIGKPNTTPIEASSWDESGRLTSLAQEGWQITYEEYTNQEGIALPSKITLKNDKASVKLLIKEWQISVKTTP
ncbi:MAG TPA: outer membrane lipoprotein LolB [Methylophilaceae bacterium]|nr:outer membrane lipoprotein LolB [Methylophilaceae bacterium]HAJ71475.1 outer membrane lipoprotein LolB [Methylophilaceae bacterium]